MKAACTVVARVVDVQLGLPLHVVGFAGFYPRVVPGPTVF